MSRSITITLDADFNLNPEDVFPDGEPEEWDAATVLALLVKDGFNEWDLLTYGVDVTVGVHEANPHHAQADALLPDHAPAPIISTHARGVVKP